MEELLQKSEKSGLDKLTKPLSFYNGSFNDINNQSVVL